MKAVILAAGRGTRLMPFTDGRPKPLVAVAGRTLLGRALDRLAEIGLSGADVIVVGGYRDDVLRAELAGTGVTIVHNAGWETYGNCCSLLAARAAAGGHGVLQIDGDLLFEAAVLERVLRSPGPAVLAVDERADLDAETMKVALRAGRLVAVAKTLPRGDGEYVGVSRFDASFAAEVWDELAALPPAGLGHEYYEHAYHRLAERGRGPFHGARVNGLLALEIDDEADLRRAEARLRP